MGRRSKRKHSTNVFQWLDVVRKRPQMYSSSLQELQAQLYGYYQALDGHRLVEPVPQMAHHFLFWVHHHTGWSTAAGWARAIEERSPELEEQFRIFFKLVDAYRQLQPTVVRTVYLGKHNKPTGKRVVIGLAGTMKRPKRVAIIQYAPEPLHFHRFFYPKRIVDASLLMRPDGSYNTTVGYAEKWMKDELQVKKSQWDK